MRSSVDALAPRPRPGPARRKRHRSPALAAERRARRAPPLAFPRDFGAHPESRIEWWYVTGMLTRGSATWGFQITFFRTATGIVGADASAFRAGDLVFAHAAVTDLAEPPPAARPAARTQRLRHRRGSDRGHRPRAARLAPRAKRRRRRRAAIACAPPARPPAFASSSSWPRPSRCCCKATPGFSRKGPEAAQFSRYYSQPQLAVHGPLALGGPTGRRRRPRLARPRMERRAARRRSGRLGLDRHEPRRRQRADGVSPAPRDGSRCGRAAAIGLPAARCATSRRRGRVRRRPALDQPGVEGALSGRVDGDHAGRRVQRSKRCRTTRSSTAAPAPARSTGKACHAFATLPAATPAAATSR